MLFEQLAYFSETACLLVQHPFPGQDAIGASLIEMP
jgi:hypothetical protein